MKKLIIICLCVFMLTPLVAQESKLKMIKGTWEISDMPEEPESKPNVANLMALAFTIGKYLTFKDNRCIITSPFNIKYTVKVEEGEKCLYMDMGQGMSYMVTILDKNTISMATPFGTVIYKRKEVK